MNRPGPSPPDCRNGAAAVELALVLPVFLMVVWGIVEFGRAMMVSQLVNNAARHGARLAVLDGSTNSDVTTQVKKFLADTVGGVKAADISVTILVTPAPGRTDPANNLTNSKINDVCKVSVAIPYKLVAYISGRFLQDATLHGACVMRHE